MRRLVAAAFGAFFLLWPVAMSWAGGYATPTAGQSPHGNYSDSTDKCKVCHAVHNASEEDTRQATDTEALLRSRRGVPEPTTPTPYDNSNNGNACVYCHIVGDWAILKVYDSDLSKYRNDSRYNHDDNHRWFHARIQYAGCMGCHSVHGANVLAGYESKIVRDDPGGALPAPVTNLTDFCRDCHEDTRAGWQDIGYGCGTCHVEPVIERGGTHGPDDETPWTNNLPPFYTQDRDGVSHIMTSTLTNPTGMQVAWADSTDCRDCHAGGNHTPSNNFPHYTSGAQFLDDAYQPPDGWTTNNEGLDRVCLNCHVEGGNGDLYTTGVGRTF